MYSVSSCPVCSSISFGKFADVKDYTVSHETFQLLKCTNCEFLFTSPRPDDAVLGRYYLSPEYISHTAKATTLFDKLYEITREFALKWKLTLVKKFVGGVAKKPNALDYGCGTGFFLKTLKENGFNIAGVEPSSIARSAAENNTGIKISESIDTVTDTFDIISLWHVLEHVGELNELLGKLKTRLAERGTIFIAVPNYKSNDAKLYGTQWAGFDVPRHLWHFEQKTMTQLLANHNFKVIEKIPMKLDAIYVSMLSEKYKAGKQSIFSFSKGLINGWISNLKASDKNYSSILYIVRHA